MKYLVVWAKDGTKTTYALKDSPQVKFTKLSLIVTKDGLETSFPIGDLQRFTYESIMPGDVNGDAKVDIVDVTKTISHIFGLSPSGFSEQAADINEDGNVDSDDVAAIAKLALSETNNVNPVSAGQPNGEAFYFYRNDGQFNAFFRGDVEKMEYSNSDADAVIHEDVVSQLVYTADSVYNIPLATIDSVGFVTPVPIVNSRVFPLTAEHLPYISDADVLSFTMSSSTPILFQPKVGDIVVATAECTAFPDGIVAKVESIVQNANGLKYNCSKAHLDEVFDQLVVYEKGIAGTADADASRGFDMRRASLTHTLWDKQWTKTIAYSGTATVLNVGDRATATVTVSKTLTTPFYFKVDLQNSMTSSVEFTAESSGSITKELQIGNTISAGRIVVPYTMGLLWLEPKLSLFGYFEEQGKVELKYGGHFNRTDNLTFTYFKGNWDFAHTPTTDVGTDVAKLSMEGSAEIGLKPQIDFSLNGQRAGFGLSGRVGLKEYINFVFDATHLSDGGLYDAMRDSYCRTTIPWSITVHASADIFSRYDAGSTDEGFATFSHTFAPEEEPQWGEDRFIFPLFDDVKGKRQEIDKTKADATALVSRTPLLPVQVGFSLLDKDDNILQTEYDERNYQVGSLFNNFNCSFTGLDQLHKYKVRPSVKLFGFDILASPCADLDSEVKACPDDNHPHMINLGLPSGTKWACCNVGASKPEEWGDYFAWGETHTKSEYNEANYSYYSGKDDDHDGYIDLIWKGDEGYPPIVNIGYDIAGTQYDAATANWGAPWRMPTQTQIKELLDNCTSLWISQNGVEGMMFIGPSGGSVFLPAAGFSSWCWIPYNPDNLEDGGYSGSCIQDQNGTCAYYSSTVLESTPASAYTLFCTSFWGASCDNLVDRESGKTVRPVVKSVSD